MSLPVQVMSVYCCTARLRCHWVVFTKRTLTLPLLGLLVRASCIRRVCRVSVRVPVDAVRVLVAVLHHDSWAGFTVKSGARSVSCAG